MSETIAVVDRVNAIESAYALGYEKADRVPEEADAEEFDLSMFKESAGWADRVSPKLRCMAGFEDPGHGTYTHGRKVALVDEPEDEPTTGELVQSHDFHRELVDAFDTGVLDKVHGDEHGATLVI